VLLAAHRTAHRRDLLLLALLLVIGAGIKGWVWHSATVLTRDGIGFIEYASRLQHEPCAHVLRTTDQHPLYPLHIYAVAECYQSVVQRTLTCYDWEFCAHLANVWTGLLLVVPMYFVGKRLGGRTVGFGAALLFQVLPVPVRVTADTLSEGLHLLCVACGIWSALHALETRRLPWFLVSGLCGGLAFLARPEGALLPLCLVLTLGLLRLLGRETSWRQTSLRAAAVSLATLMVVAPYWLTIRKFSPKGGAHAMGTLAETCVPLQKGTGEESMGGGSLLLASRFQPGVDGDNYDVTATFVMCEVSKELVKGFHYLFWLPALFGLGLLVRLLRMNPEDAPFLLLLVLCAANLLILCWLGWRAHYVSERHTMLIVLIGCWPALLALQAGADMLCQRWPRMHGHAFQAQGFVVALSVGFCLVQSLQPLHEHRKGHRLAGEWLANQWQEGDRLVDAYGWVSFYSGQRTPPRQPPDVKGRLFWVKEEGEKDHLRNVIINGVQRQQESTPAFAWPIAKDRRVVVYVIPPKITPAPPMDQAALKDK
jgi:hypothetical protein